MFTTGPLFLIEPLVVVVAVGCTSRVKVASYILRVARQSYQQRLQQREHERMTKTVGATLQQARRKAQNLFENAEREGTDEIHQFC
jgi:cytochrome c-type biogenesis protein CcmH/NrfG